MIFSSYTYLAFLLVTFVAHWSMPISWRKPFLVLASYVFYASWKWEFTGLLLGVTLFNWTWARWVLFPSPGLTRLWIGVLTNLAPLLYFKYAGFLVGNAASVAGWFGSSWHPQLQDIILPLGISFFTFQAVAYLVDVAAGEDPVNSLLDYMLFKAFWPQLIAGPIIRLSEIREQLQGERHLEYASYAEGGRRILGGLFKKVVLADTLGPIADLTFLPGARIHAIDGATGALAFGLQIYFDFSAYSDIAIGSALLFGFRFPENFDWPYTAASPQEFWDRWHMSLSRWIRDYVFAPIAFSMRHRPAMAPVWILLAMAICGLWHGAAWTFVAWGVWHGLLLVANQTILKRVFPTSARKSSPRAWMLLPLVAVTFAAVHAGWVLFRAQSLSQAFSMLTCVTTLRGGLRPSVLRENDVLIVAVIFLGLLLCQACRKRASEVDWTSGGARVVARVVKPVLYVGALILVIVFAQDARTFVYFQF